jgi:hypothetical protein
MATSLFDLSANTTVATKSAYTFPTPVRTVNVANQTQLDAAVAASLPGDHILLNPTGTYTGFEFNTHSGTTAHPILIGTQTSARLLMRECALLF